MNSTHSSPRSSPLKETAELLSKEPISVKVSPQLLKAIDAIAVKDDRSRNATMRLALSQYVTFRQSGTPFENVPVGKIEKGDRGIYRKRAKPTAKGKTAKGSR